MSYQAEEVLSFLATHGPMTTRLRERSIGDVHDVPTMLPTPLGITVRPEETVTLLEELEQQGLVRRSERVHAFDSAEFIVTWQSVRR
jgi:hypothetical protein